MYIQNLNQKEKRKDFELNELYTWYAAVVNEKHMTTYTERYKIQS